MNGDYHAYNSSKNATYTWTADQAAYFNEHILPTYDRESWGGRQAVAGEHKMGTNDLAFAYLENTKETAIDLAEAEAQPFYLQAAWVKDGDKVYYGVDTDNSDAVPAPLRRTSRKFPLHRKSDNILFPLYESSSIRTLHWIHRRRWK